MKKWQIKNSEISKISEILSRVFLFLSFRFWLQGQIENSDLKILEKNFRDFRGFQVSAWPALCFVVDGLLTEWFSVSVGVRQGCLLSPTFF